MRLIELRITKMAEGYNEKIILKNEENISDGHRVQYDLVIDNLAARESYVLKQNFFTRCESYSTSWKFLMVIRPIRVDDTINIPVTLKRFDKRNCVVNASINVSLSNSKGEIFFGVPRNFLRPRMASGDEFIGYIAGYLQPSQQRNLFNQMLTIRAIIEIRDCHTLDNPFSAASFATENELQDE